MRLTTALALSLAAPKLPGSRCQGRKRCLLVLLFFFLFFSFFFFFFFSFLHLFPPFFSFFELHVELLLVGRLLVPISVPGRRRLVNVDGLVVVCVDVRRVALVDLCGARVGAGHEHGQ